MDLANQFEVKLEEVLALAGSGSYELALSQLEQTWTYFRPHDEDHWMERAVLAQRGILLGASGRYREAVSQLRAAQDLGPNVLEYAANQEALARTLQDSGDAESAIQELEAGLAKATGDAEPLALRMLVLYAGLAEARNSTVPLRYGTTFVRAARHWDLEVPSGATCDEVTFTRVLSGIGARFADAN